MSEYKLTDLQEQWLKALESGTYNQADGALCRQKFSGARSYCCLGVACDVISKIKNDPSYRFDAPDNEDFRFSAEDGQAIESVEVSCRFDNECGVLSDRIWTELKLRDHVGGFNKIIMVDDIRFTSLASMNDRGISHQRIAEVIRANAHSIFTP